MRDGPFGAGDVVEVSLEEIGLLRNTLVSPE
jgi:2-keto-4-pentenoate hydratase/2-oxohepta-3-ene-1,7-dioic acid hydratase in catechol pathway